MKPLVFRVMVLLLLVLSSATALSQAPMPVSWGATMDEVLAAESLKIDTSFEDSVAYTTTLFDTPALKAYSFDPEFGLTMLMYMVLDQEAWYRAINALTHKYGPTDPIFEWSPWRWTDGDLQIELSKSDHNRFVIMYTSQAMTERLTERRLKREAEQSEEDAEDL